jgi:hypothetical protein
MYLLVLVMHFDTFCFPQLWLTAFRDGSNYERTTLGVMLLFWIGGLHICTSTLSVGEVQANVYFTAWIAFLSSVVNCGVWRVSAGRKSIAEWANNHHRETTYNWLWTLFFVCTYAGAITIVYMNEEYVQLWLKGQEIDLTRRQWVVSLSVSWGFVGVCIVSLLFNHYWIRSCEIKLFGGSRFVFGWRQAEGFVALGMVAIFFLLVYDLTGVNGVLGLGKNGYFGLWGVFINSVFTLATWLRENKNLEYIICGQTEESII